MGWGGVGWGGGHLPGVPLPICLVNTIEDGTHDIEPT